MLVLIKVDFDKAKGGGFRERKMFQGNWKCADCGAEITELPFEPREGSEVRCHECYRKTRPPRNFR